MNQAPTKNLTTNGHEWTPITGRKRNHGLDEFHGLGSGAAATCEALCAQPNKRPGRNDFLFAAEGGSHNLQNQRESNFANSVILSKNLRYQCNPWFSLCVSVIRVDSC
jgi:hypothetical protein